MARLPQSPLARRRRFRALFLIVTVAVVAALLVSRTGTHKKSGAPLAGAVKPIVPAAAPSTTEAPHVGLATPSSYAPGVPANHDPNNLYYYDGANLLSPKVANDPPRIYVPNTESNTVSIVDPSTYKVIKTIPVGKQPQHVSPSWDLKTLWVANDQGNTPDTDQPDDGGRRRHGARRRSLQPVLHP